MVIDVGHQWGGDLDVSPSGDLAVATGSPAVTQRVLRRLLTNPKTYIWNLSYGAGLPGFIGTTAANGQIEAVVRSQIMREPAIARSPAPTVSVSDLKAPGTGAFEVSILYTEDPSGQQNLVSIPITG